MPGRNQQYQILQTKLFRPRPTSDLVLRHRLIKKLDYGLQLPFILISAPSGFGKSSLVSAWLENTEIKNAWLSLEGGDSDLIQFLQYFVEAIRKEDEFFGSRLIPLLDAPEFPPLEVLTTSLLNDLAGLKEEMLLVLDDYHFIHDTEVHQLIVNLMQFPIPHFHLVMTSRQDPPFPLIEWRKKNRLIEIRINDLTFTTEEITTFFKKSKHVSLPHSKSDSLLSLTEGWASGLRLVSFNINSVEDVEIFISKQQSFDMLGLEEMVNNILERQPPETLEYILKASISDQFCADLLDHLCLTDKNKVLGKQGKAIVERMERSNLFIIDLDDRNNWYRYHHLFLDLLRNKAQETYPLEELQKIHEKIADWLILKGYLEDAIKHYIQASQWGKAIIGFNRLRRDLINKNKWQKLIQLFELFPEDIQNRDSILKITKAWILMYQFKIFEFFEFMDNIEPWNFISSTEDIGIEDLIGELNTFYAYRTYNMVMDYKLCLKQSRIALNKLTPDNLYARGLAWIFVGGALHITKDANSALEVISDGMEKEKSSLVQSQLYMISNYIYWIDGNLSALLKGSELHYQMGVKADLNEAVVNGRFFKGIAHYMSNDLENAKVQLESAYSNRWFVLGVHHINLVYALVLTYFETGEKEKAQKIADDLSEYASATGNGSLILFTQSLQAELSFRLNDYPKAKDLIDLIESTPVYPLSNFSAPHLVYVKALIYFGEESNFNKAAQILDALEPMLQKTQNKRFLPEVYGYKAMLFAERGQDQRAFKYLNKAIELLHHGKFIRAFIDQGPKMFELLKKYANLNGGFPYQDEILSVFESKISPGSKVKVDLTFREMDILKLIHAKLTNQQIGDKLFISEKTVKRHAGSIFKKLKCKNRREAAVWADEFGIVF